MPRRSSVSLTLLRNVVASAGVVPAADEDGVRAQPDASAQTMTGTSTSRLSVMTYPLARGVGMKPDPTQVVRSVLNYRRMRIGIDLGGTKIEGVAIGDDGSERLRRRIASPRDDYRATLAAVAGLVHDIERELGARGTVGIGIPGTV